MSTAAERDATRREILDVLVDYTNGIMTAKRLPLPAEPGYTNQAWLTSSFPGYTMQRNDQIDFVPTFPITDTWDILTP